MKHTALFSLALFSFSAYAADTVAPTTKSFNDTGLSPSTIKEEQR